MKRTIFILSFLVIFCLPSLVKADFWKKSYFLNNYNNSPPGKFLYPTRDGNYTISGANGWKVWILKVRSSGDVMWAKFIVQENNSEQNLSSFRPASEGFVLSTLYRTNLVANYGGMTASIIKLDQDADIEWQHFYLNKVFYSGDESRFYYHLVRINNIKQTTDSGYIAIGSIQPNGPYDDNDILLLKLNSSGGIEWHKILDAINENEYSLQNKGVDVIQTSDSGFIGIGEAGYQKLAIFKFSAQGELLWQKVFQHGAAKRIEKTPDGKYAVLFSYLQNENSNPAILKIDTDGNILWQKRYHKGFYNGNLRFAENGNYLLAIGYYLYRLDSNGDVIWARGYPNQFLAFDVREIEDGYLLALNGDRIQLTKLDNFGYSCSSSEEINDSAQDLENSLASITLVVHEQNKVIEVMNSDFTSTSIEPESTNECRKYGLAVELGGEGEGTVSSSPQGIDCPGTCSALFNGGTM